jgi:hypothetical protein
MKVINDIDHRSLKRKKRSSVGNRTGCGLYYKTPFTETSWERSKTGCVDRTGPSSPLRGAASRVDAVDRNGCSPLLTNAAAEDYTIGGLGRNEWTGGDGESPSRQSGLRSCALLFEIWFRFRATLSLAPILSVCGTSPSVAMGWARL